MKKIFFAIIALAACVGCNTNVMEEVATTPQYLTTSFEVDLNGESRAFDSDLKWGWIEGDQIAAFQADGTYNYLNALTYDVDKKKFCNTNFKYATNDPADFKFVYPVEALNADKSLGYVQTGFWTPTLVGSAHGTIDNIGNEPIKMEHKSAAFEIRVWDEGSKEGPKVPKNIKAATITSTEDFCNGKTATVQDLKTDTGTDTNTVVFNIAKGNFAFNLTLTATDGATYSVAVPAKNFVNGQRTILNVEWKYPKPVVSFNVLSSYTNKDNSLDGRSIYVKDVVLTNADSAAIALYLNDNKAADLTPGKTTTVSNLALGEYKAVVKWTVNGKEYTSGETKVYVTGIPYTLNPAANDSWNAWATGGNVKWNNADRGTAVRIGHAFGSDLNTGESYIQKSFFVPENTTVTVTSRGEARGSRFIWDISTTNTLSVSGTTVDTAKASGKDVYKEFNYSKSVTMTADNPIVKHHNSNSTNEACTYVNTLTIMY